MQLDVIMIDIPLSQIHPLDTHHLLPDLAPRPITPDDQVEPALLPPRLLVARVGIVPLVFVGLDRLAGVLVRIAGFGIGGRIGPGDVREFGAKVQGYGGGQGLDEAEVEEWAGE